MARDAAARALAGAAIIVAAAALWAIWGPPPEVRLAPVAWTDIAPPAPVALRPWTTIVIHHSAAPVGDPAGIDRHHAVERKWDGIGYHFVIGNGHGMPLGRIEATFRWRGQSHGAHAGDEAVNQRGIGICVIGDFERAPPDPRLADRLADLCAVLIEHCGALSVESIVGHKDVKASTLCPGAHLDLGALRALVRTKLAARAAAGVAAP
ncbi:MAG TPA: peptidoglycan recognition family protein [Planctomycetota bacterium]|nr:peptidoglycan recognition family protein [Planctomycetota bacterium]